ncbi:DUF3280 domain-containing protein [Methylobacterium brachiatum]|uniref:DUF3280 domain-containing protein n=1 Tax=Methylobacterium brachiatum TaxID=269660 RepID=UPI0008F25E9C|nr:DUF3280 domain-containing protein [Methylobacterium brachiatum]AYO82966.1 DUF2380 domain-containing protein [Methylobacterium brachiatum]SFH94792.1 Protein of unknown function [Methylobacterium brachiatum]
MFRTAFCAAALLLAAGPAFAAPEKAAVFDFQFSNLSPVPGDEADRARLDRTSAQLRDLLAKKGLFEVVPTDPVKEEVAKSADLRRCNGCAEDFARKLGADVAITGEVQKVSNLILNLNVYVKQLSGNVPEKAYSVDLRGDTDESFARGIRFLVENNMGAGK